jgi:UDP-4-amino-4,6-dideoxy-N-acetyl-beta-L-altrosamine N-acetyltransferase
MKNAIINKDFYSFSSFTDLDSEETELVWKWRNNEVIRKWMYSSEIIPFENHLKFIEKLKVVKNKLYYLVKRDQIPIGVFSIIDIKDQTGEWGYYIAPEYHDKSFGVEFYYYVLQFVFETLNFKKITGLALVKNKSANSLNGLFGFTKKLVSKSENKEIREYYYRELFAHVWCNEVRINKKIHRFLQLKENNQIIK